MTVSGGAVSPDFAASMRGAMKDSGKTAADLDAARRRNMAYEYLCHLEEAKKYRLDFSADGRWMEACLKSELPPASELETALRNGVIVAKLAMFFAPEVVKQKNVYDFDEAVFKACCLILGLTQKGIRLAISAHGQHQSMDQRYEIRQVPRGKQ